MRCQPTDDGVQGGGRTDAQEWRPLRVRGTCRVTVLLLAAFIAMAGTPAAQTLPVGPATAFDGRLVAGVEVIATIGERDDTAFFNYTDYEHNLLRLIRIAATAAWHPADRVAFVGEIRSENMEDVRPYGAYVRVRPWRDHAFDVQAGRVPPAFGSFGRRPYATDNPLIGYPLAYSYLTSLRPDAVPRTVDDLLRMRGRGWRTSFPVGSTAEAPGLPLVAALRWDLGVQGRWNGGPVEAIGGITAGTLSNPRLADDNGGKQVSGRVAVRPVIGLVIGASAAHGAWLSREVAPPVASRDYSQRAFGADAEYSRGYWLVRAELIRSAWDLPPLAADGTTATVSALAAWVEGRYRLTPRLFAAARLDRLGFSRVAGGLLPAGPWDAPVRRVETGIGFYIQRNLVARGSVQWNARDGGRVHRRTYVAGQLAYWF
jgi:hypothetical protein